ncbi:MAG: DUF1638 domain-containing protein [Clostridia bacterium]|nr:DUF1638 domain-containing protein [Clostridia bacterium]
MKRLKVIACDVLNREISYLASLSDCFVDVTFLDQGLHCTPDLLRQQLQEQVALAQRGFSYGSFETAVDYDFIILGYGLCSNGVVGVVSEKVPLVVPRGHDCITLLLGSKERYREYFDSHPGTYWYSKGWIERSIQPGEERCRIQYDAYVRKYGEDNADYLMETEQGWMNEYKNATFLSWDSLGNLQRDRDYTKACAEYLGWEYDELNGSPTLLEDILNGRFDERQVAIVPPGRKITASYDDGIVAFE